MRFTACYTKLDDGKYMGKLLEWRGAITEGDDLEDCRNLLQEVANELAEIYKDEGKKIPYTPLVVEPMYVSVEPECLQCEEEALIANVS